MCAGLVDHVMGRNAGSAGHRCDTTVTMLDYLLRLAADVLRRLGPFRGPSSNPPGDPHAAVWEPRPRKPVGPRSAVAVAEPERPHYVDARARVARNARVDVGEG
jgi:hypothetical protein